MTTHDEPAIDVEHLEHQREWSRETFGPGPRSAGVVDHLRRELLEIEAAPYDLGEWVDVIILAFDGAWRAGHEPAEIIAAVKAKQARNEQRTWPDWKTAAPDQAIEHVRSAGPFADDVAVEDAPIAFITPQSDWNAVCQQCGRRTRPDSVTTGIGPCPDCTRPAEGGA